jgi:F0F1-type ATP synthase delta subunit
MKDNYTKAAQELIEAGMPVETVLVDMKKLMVRKGHDSLYLGVLKSLVQQLELSQKTSIPTVVVSKSDSEALKNAPVLLAELGCVEKEFNTVVDPTLVGGLIVSHNHKMIDQSHKTKLRNLYQSIVS